MITSLWNFVNSYPYLAPNQIDNHGLMHKNKRTKRCLHLKSFFRTEWKIFQVYHFQKIAEKSNILKKNESSTFEFTLVISKYMIRRPTGLFKKFTSSSTCLIWQNSYLGECHFSPFRICFNHSVLGGGKYSIKLAIIRSTIINNTISKKNNNNNWTANGTI